MRLAMAIVLTTVRKYRNTTKNNKYHKKFITLRITSAIPLIIQGPIIKLTKSTLISPS